MLQEIGLFPPRGAPFPTLILLVEDDPANAQFFLHILTQEASFRVFWATNGRAALHFTQHVKPQLFLLEYSLPDMNGIILYDRLHARKELATVPALIVGASLKEGEDAINCLVPFRLIPNCSFQHELTRLLGWLILLSGRPSLVRFDVWLQHRRQPTKGFPDDL